MSNRFRTIIICVLSVVVLLLPSRFMESVVLACGNTTSGWFPMLNLNHNAFYMWRVDHLSRFFIALFAPEYSAEKPLFRFIILFFGTGLIVRSFPIKQEPRLWALSIIPVLLALASVGLNPLVLGTLAWAPITAVICRQVLRSENPGWWWLLLGLVVLESCMSANQASLVWVAMVIFLVITTKSLSERSISQPRRFKTLITALLVPALYTVITAPMPPLPDIPRGGHVIAERDFEGSVTPLIGPAYPFEVLDRDDLTKLYKPVAHNLLLFSLFSLFIAHRGAAPLTRRMVIAATALSAASFIDTNLPDSWALIGPIASVSRLLPWGTYYALTAISLGFVAWLLGMVWVAAPRKWMAYGMAALALYSISSAAPTLYRPFLQQYVATKDMDLRRILCSPSAAVIRHFAVSHPNLVRDLSEMKTLGRKRGVDVTTLGATISLSPELVSKDFTETKPAETYWRWSTRRGKQLGDEVLTIRFPSPTTIRGVEFDPGNYSTDFPRGLTVRGGDCDGGPTRILSENPSWQGSLSFTPRAYPYLSPRSQVRVFFSQTETVSCLFAHQTGQATFDWSVSRVRVIQ